MIAISGKFIFTTVILSILGFGFWLAYKPWFRLAKAFGTKIDPPEIFYKEQSCILHQTRINGYINVGIIEQKLYLSHTSPLSYFIQALLIDPNAIAKIEPCFDPLLGESYKIFIGKPNITTLILAQKLIKKLEEDCGELIFSNKL